jgi:hypothetical protein
MEITEVRKASWHFMLLNPPRGFTLYELDDCAPAICMFGEADLSSLCVLSGSWSVLVAVNTKEGHLNVRQDYTDNPFPDLCIYIVSRDKQQ